MVSVLYTQKNSIYQQLNVDCWDITRDARTFSGTNAVVCHPPCRAWGRLRHFAKPRWDEKELAVSSIAIIRANGGVLEHPAGSKLWSELNLPLGSATDVFGGFTISINQSWFGHRAKKNTWLYICGCSRSQVPRLMLSFDAITHVVGSSKKCRSKSALKELSKKGREATPLHLANFLINIAIICNNNKKQYNG